MKKSNLSSTSLEKNSSQPSIAFRLVSWWKLLLIGTDIIVGFPGETKKAFEKTVDLCQQVGFVKAYIARYSPRPGTAAFKFRDDVSSDEKKKRWRILEDLINCGKLQTWAGFLGLLVKAIVLKLSSTVLITILTLGLKKQVW